MPISLHFWAALLMAFIIGLMTQALITEIISTRKQKWAMLVLVLWTLVCVYFLLKNSQLLGYL